MAALLVILTFLLFCGLDYLISRRRAMRYALEAVPAAPRPAAKPVPPEEPVWVAGYQMPAALHYHPGHSWARVLAPDTVAVGLDDFARRLLGRAERVRLPAVGSWVRQGAPGARIQVDGRGADLLAPVEGEVVEVNADVRRDPQLCTSDPYGRGWLYKVRSPSLGPNVRNLLHGRLAQKWMQDAREQLEFQLMALSGSVLQDGGEPAPGFAERLEGSDWRRLTSLFFLTGNDEG